MSASLGGAEAFAGGWQRTGIPGPGRQRLLFSFAARPLFSLRTLFAAGPPGLGPIGDVLDGAQIEVAVSTNEALSGPGEGEVNLGDVLVVLTGQPFGEIAERLQRGAGYEEAADGLLLGGEPIERDGDLRIATVYDEFPFPAVGDAGGGVVVFGGSAGAVRAALEGAEAELTAAAELLAELPGVAADRASSSWRLSSSRASRGHPIPTPKR